jgi:hypothetical protein
MAKLTGQQLLAVLAQVNKDTADFKELWQGYLADIPLPPDFEIKNAVRRLALQDLADGIQSYASQIGQTERKESKYPRNAKGAMNYICGTAWKILEKEHPDQKFQPTARRQRNAERDPNSPQWNGEACGNATPEERQKIMAEIIAEQKARGAQ